MTPVGKPKPFGYFRPTVDGWEDCAPTAEGARPLYEAPVDVPTLDDFEIAKLFQQWFHKPGSSHGEFARMVESAARNKAGLP